MTLARSNLPPWRLIGWLLAALVAVAMLWSNHPWGVGITGDSVGFIRTARSLAQGHGWETSSALYPPLFPLLLAPFPLLGIDPAAGGRYLEAGLFAAILVVVWHWMLSNLQTRTAPLLGLLALATSNSMVEAAGLLHTEVPFMLAMTLALVAGDRYWRDGSGAWLFTFGLFCALASSVRYVGVTIVMAGGLLILLRPGFALPVRLRHAALFGATSASLVLIWLARNWVWQGTLVGGRHTSEHAPAVTLSRAWAVVSGWVWPPRLDDPFHAAAAVGLSVAVAAAAYVLIRSRREAAVPVTHRPVIFALFLPLYLVFIVLVAFRVGRMLEARYLTPAVVPLVLLAAYGLDLCLLRCRGMGREGRILAFATGAGLSVWLLGYSLTQARLNLTYHHANGFLSYNCYNSRLWQSTEAIALLKRGVLKGAVYSNNPRVVYYYSGLPMHRIPTPDQLDRPDQRNAFRQRVAEQLKGTDPVYLLYLRDPRSRGLQHRPALPNQLGGLVSLAPSGPRGTIRVHYCRSRRCARK